MQGRSQNLLQWGGGGEYKANFTTGTIDNRSYNVNIIGLNVKNFQGARHPLHPTPVSAPVNYIHTLHI